MSEIENILTGCESEHCIVRPCDSGKDVPCCCDARKVIRAYQHEIVKLHKQLDKTLGLIRSLTKESEESDDYDTTNFLV